ncbi:hypothetical protein RND71_015909 [Anisodus tanguticus]|uniref:Uncharacterized protein n=1 Tax=Anisodus tanguticus TaxID=243964 RepID=A0AAE1S8W1_9SOLA|nr:hypothetical protein RND71_015909 [Anisodus tanguticus]
MLKHINDILSEARRLKRRERGEKPLDYKERSESRLLDCKEGKKRKATRLYYKEGEELQSHSTLL